MAKVSLKHYLLKSRGEQGNLPIYFRITYNRKKAELHSGYTSSIKDWSETNQSTKSNNSINGQLAEQKAKIYDLMVQLQKGNKPITAELLKGIYQGKTKLQTLVLDYLRAYIAELKIRNEIKTISLNKYSQSLTTLIKFIESKYGRRTFQLNKSISTLSTHTTYF
jgi:hypothetical protein